MPLNNYHFYFHLPLIGVNREMKEIYAHRTIELIAVAMIAIFVPIYFIKIGYTFQEIMLYMMVAYGSLALFSPLFAMLVSRVGFKRLIIPRPFTLIAYFLLLYSLPDSGVSIYLIGLWWGVTNSLYWTSLNTLYGINLDKKKQGQEVSYNAMLGNIVMVISPIIGGLAIFYFGFHALFVFICLILLVSVVPLFLSPDYPIRQKLDFKPNFTFRNMRYTMGLIATGMRYSAAGIIIPLFLYSMSASTASVGIVYALLPAATVTTLFYVGKITDGHSKKKILHRVIPFYSLAWFMLLFARDAYSFSILLIVMGLMVPFVYVPFSAKFYMRMREKNVNPLKLLMLHELGLGFGRLILFGLCYVAIDPYAMAMVTAGVGSWLYLFL